MQHPSQKSKQSGPFSTAIDIPYTPFSSLILDLQPSMAGQQFVFISANDFGRTDSTDQMRIRSHCMQGKNRKAGSRRSKRNAASKEHQVLSQALNPPLTFPDKSPAFQCSEDARTERPHIPSSSVEGDDDEINPSDLYLSPPFLSSCLAFLPLADELNCTSREYLSECRYPDMFSISTNFILC